jgi:SH3-like domain-containing protein
MVARALVVLCLLAAASPVLEQTSPPASVPHAPAKADTAPTPPPPPPTAAPRVAVQQVAPLTTPASKPAQANQPKKPTPVVKPSHSSHARKPAATPKPGATPASAPATPPPPPAPAAAPQPDKPAETIKGTITGLPLPRWASLRSDEVNLRSGPGTRYPVEWVYRRRSLPVQIEREFEVWRLIRDQDGIRGWVHQATLTSRRAFVVEGKEHALRSAAADTAPPVAMLKPGVIGRIRDCEAGRQWCEMQVGNYRGWLKREDIWGTFPGEAVN